jgi:exopolyphosphatase
MAEAAGPVTAVTGSSAADLDSVVGSIGYAYLLAREGGLTGPVFPYLPIPRADLLLRTEVVHLFERVGLNWENLVFADDIDLEHLLGGREGELVLVDTQGHDAPPVLRERITEVIDHHWGDQTAHARRPLKRRIVEPVGSACTLVSEQILQRKPGILDRQLATLLLAAVLLDTVNLDPDAGRATEKDREIAGSLIKVARVDTKGLYNELVRARSDVEGLSSTRLLDKDYKERMIAALRLGMSSVPLLLDSWRRRDERLEEALSGFLADRALDILVVFLYRRGRGFKRQLILCSTDERLLNHVAAKLAQPLGLAEIPAQSRGGEGLKRTRPAGSRRAVIRCFAQRETTGSRKRIEPLLRQILTSL